MSIFDNKPAVTTTWNLNIHVEPGMMIEGEWYPGAQIDMHKWKFSVTLDDQLLTNITGITKNICYAKNIADTSQQEHVLTFSLKDAGNIEHQMLKLNIEIEHVNINVLIEQLGQYILDDGTVKTGGVYMGESGQQRLVITTPIYKWLLDNRYSIINSYHNNAIK